MSENQKGILVTLMSLLMWAFLLGAFSDKSHHIEDPKMEEAMEALQESMIPSPWR